MGIHRNRLPTERQKRLVLELLSGKHKSVGSAMRAAGFSKTTAINPHIVFAQRGIKHLLEELGLTETFLVSNLKQDIIAKPGDRARELEMGFRLHGSFPSEKVEVDIFRDYSDEQLEEFIKANLSKIKKEEHEKETDQGGT